MKSFQIVWTIDLPEVHCISGNCYVQAPTSAKAKQILREVFERSFPTAERIELGRALQRCPNDESVFVQPDETLSFQNNLALVGA